MSTFKITIVANKINITNIQERPLKKVWMISAVIVAILIIVTLAISVSDKIYPISMGIHDELDLREGIAHSNWKNQ